MFDNIQLEEIIRKRKSVRSFDKKNLTNKDLEEIKKYIKEIEDNDSPFKADIHIHLLETKKLSDNQKLGTYGVIHGATTFLGVTVKKTDNMMEAIGYNFEKLILLLTNMGIGTCWLAGTFNREQFESNMKIEKNEIFPIVCPIGYPADKKTFIESVFRSVGKSDQRKEWDKIFFENDFNTPLNRDDIGDYVLALEMLRLAPSAANKQPWRILYKNGNYHFYKEVNPNNKYPYDLQRLDVGIGACHFHLTCIEKGLRGEFQVLKNIDEETPKNLEYLFSWVVNKKK